MRELAFRRSERRRSELYRHAHHGDDGGVEPGPSLLFPSEPEVSCTPARVCTDCHYGNDAASTDTSADLSLYPIKVSRIGSPRMDGDPSDSLRVEDATLRRHSALYKVCAQVGDRVLHLHQRRNERLHIDCSALGQHLGLARRWRTKGAVGKTVRTSVGGERVCRRAESKRVWPTTKEREDGVPALLCVREDQQAGR